MNRLRCLTLTGLALLAIPSQQVRAESATPAPSPDRDQIIHVLNRITFGIRPGDIEAVQGMGLQNYINQQLHPEKIDDSAVEKQLAGFPILSLSQEDLNKLYVDDVYLRNVDREAKMAKKAADSGQQLPQKVRKAYEDPAKISESRAMISAYGGYRTAVPELEHAKLIRAINSPRQLQEVLADFWNNHFNIDVKKKECSVYKVTDDRDVIRPHIFGKFRDLLEASAKSPAMLHYLDNDQNSSPAAAAPAKAKAPEMQQETAMMTGAAMSSTAPPKPKKRSRGINENYAREIMELHTLGVDGGYTQKDVQEVARCFTGWTVDRNTGLFKFDANRHDNGSKVVLGHVIPAGGGMKDGETVLDILASRPATAHFISRELCQRFVADNPPPALVNRVAGVFTRTGGDLRAVTAAILTSQEFLDPSTWGNKIKSPVEFAVSAVRASGSTYVEGGHFDGANKRPGLESAAIIGRNGNASDRIATQKQSLNYHVFTLGQPLFACTPPTGYKEVSSTWVSPGALIERLNFAMALTGQQVSDVNFSTKNVLGGTGPGNSQAMLDQCVLTLLQGHVSDATKKVLAKAAQPAADDKTADPDKLIALIIGSPEFQRK